VTSAIGIHRWFVSKSRSTPAPCGEDVESLDVTGVFARYGEFVWTSLQRLGVRTPDLEDLLQEVFVIVHRRLPAFDAAISPMRAWLFGICKRVVLAHRRRAHVRRERPLPNPAEESPAADAASPEHALCAQETRAKLDAVLDDLDLEKRAVLVMFEIDEMSCEEIATILAIPVGTVHSRLHAARKAFEKALARHNACHRRSPWVPFSPRSPGTGPHRIGGDLARIPFSPPLRATGADVAVGVSRASVIQRARRRRPSSHGRPCRAGCPRRSKRHAGSTERAGGRARSRRRARRARGAW
jgi:RNA polymerase sigma-70 factor (ECF subfamily)